MSEVRVNNLSNENNTGGPTISGITTYSGRHFFVPPQGDTASRPSDCEPGSFRFNTDSAKLEYFRGNTIGWVEIEAELTAPLGGGTGSNTGLGNRGLFGSGQKAPSSGNYSDTIEFLTISTLGNSEDFGNLSDGTRASRSGLSSRTRALFGAGYGPADDMHFVTMASKGNSTAFGLDLGNRNGQGGLSNGTRGVMGGGGSPSLNNNVMSYVTISTAANAVDFGDLTTTNGRSGIGACASTTRGIFAGGGSSDVEYNIIDFITIATTGNATDFGDLNYTSTYGVGSGSNATRAIWWGGTNTPGYSVVNTISFNTITTTGNAIDFGDTSVTTHAGAACPDGTRCVMKLGSSGSGATGFTTNIEYVQFASTGNSIDFGDSVENTLGVNLGAMSTGHGGLG